MTLYELSDEMRQLYEMMEDPDVDEEVLLDTMEGVEAELHDKADGYVFVMKELEADAEKIDKEIKRLQAMKKRAENGVARLKTRLQMAMEYCGESKFETKLFKFSIRNNPPAVVIDDESKIPFEFWVPQDPVVDKKAIKEFLKDSETCEFAHLTTTQSLRIS